jgi:hypothetical protein
MRAPFVQTRIRSPNQKKRPAQALSLRPFAFTAASSLWLNHRSVSSVGRAFALSCCWLHSNCVGDPVKWHEGLGTWPVEVRVSNGFQALCTTRAESQSPTLGRTERTFSHWKNIWQIRTPGIPPSEASLIAAGRTVLQFCPYRRGLPTAARPFCAAV